MPRTIADFRAHTVQAVLKDEDEHDDAMFIGLLSDLGADTRSYQREAKQARRLIVSEIFSLHVSPSFSQACPRAGSSRDLPWT